MSLVRLTERKVDMAIVEYLERLLAMAKAGDVNEMVVVCSGVSEGEPVYRAFVDYNDSWRLLGALEYAKCSVMRVAGY